MKTVLLTLLLTFSAYAFPPTICDKIRDQSPDRYEVMAKILADNERFVEWTEVRTTLDFDGKSGGRKSTSTTVLIEAVKAQDVEMVRFLVEHGAQICDYDHYRCALPVARKIGNAEILQILLEYKEQNDR